MSEPEEHFRLDPALTQIDDTAFIARGAVVLGDVQVGADASVWYGAVLRGDTEAIRVGPRSNVQDGSVLHADPGFPCVLGAEVTVGHRCVVHGARVGDRCLLGMGAILMNGATLGEECLVGAGALITEGKVFPPRSLILGAPAQVRRPLTEAEIADLRSAAAHYVAAARAHRAR